MEHFNEFIGVVKKYSEAYRDFEKLQKSEAPEFDFIPKVGDQKTGVVGEAFVFEYLKRKGHSPEFGGTVQEGWDIKYTPTSVAGDFAYVQVKAVSAFAKTKKINPIKLSPDNCEFCLISLDENLLPDDIWRAKGYNDSKIKIQDGKKVLTGIKMPQSTEDDSSGFTQIENVFEDFKRHFPELYPTG